MTGSTAGLLLVGANLSLSRAGMMSWGAVILAIWSAMSYFHGFWKVVGPRIMAENSHLTGPKDSE